MQPEVITIMYFNDRKDAGEQLAARLSAYEGQEAVVLALPRGGVPVAAQIAERLGLPLDLLVVRKIGIPWQPEVAMGAVIDGEQPVVVRNEDMLRHGHVTEADFEAVAERELSEIERRKSTYLRERPAADLTGRTVIVVDDGVATGATIKAALRGLKKKLPGKTILAIPVADPRTVEALQELVDVLVCLHSPEGFSSVGAHYGDFDQLSDDEVVEILARHRAL